MLLRVTRHVCMHADAARGPLKMKSLEAISEALWAQPNSFLMLFHAEFKLGQGGSNCLQHQHHVGQFLEREAPSSLQNQVRLISILDLGSITCFHLVSFMISHFYSFILMICNVNFSFMFMDALIGFDLLLMQFNV